VQYMRVGATTGGTQGSSLTALVLLVYSAETTIICKGMQFLCRVLLSATRAVHPSKAHDPNTHTQTFDMLTQMACSKAIMAKVYPNGQMQPQALGHQMCTRKSRLRVGPCREGTCLAAGLSINMCQPSNQPYQPLAANTWPLIVLKRRHGRATS
jgi:hypothetical protein